MRKNLMIALVAGTLCPAALAQVNDLDIPVMPFGGHVVLNPVGTQPGYGERAIGIVYDNGSNVFGGGGQLIVLGSNHVLDDVTFAPGPWAGGTSRVITSMNWFTQLSGTACSSSGGSSGSANFPFDTLFEFYSGASFTAPDMLGGATLIATVRIATALQCGFVWSVTTDLTALPGGGVVVPDGSDTIYIRQRNVATGTTTLLPFASSTVNPGVQYSFPVWGLEPQTRVGTSLSSYGRDINGDNILTGGSPIITGAGAGAHEHREVNAGAPVRGMCLRLFGDIPPPPPPVGINVGCLADGSTTVNNAGGSGVQWFEVCLPGGAEDGLLQYLDIDSEGSSSDVAIALFSSAGTIAGLSGTDQDDGSGTNAQLTFGVGRRAAVGDGLQYDGRDGQLPGGTYYLAVAPGGSSFGDAYTVNSAGTNGAFTINFRTNVNGSPAGAFVTPLINGVDYSIDVPPGGPITFPLDIRPGIGLESGLRGVRWHRFELTDTAGSGDSYMDFDFARLSTGTADGIALVFNSNGDIVFISDDEGDGLLPLLSWGVGTGPRTYPPAVSVYSGANGTISPGTYYVATALFPIQILPAAPDRFHVRGTSGSNLTVGFDIYAGGTPGGGSNCEPDFNQDGNVDQDDIACLAQVVAGDPSCSSLDPDFNGDGNVDQDDIDALAQVVAGSPCP